MTKRYQLHLAGKASKYTRSFKPIGIALCLEVDGDKSHAMQIEREIKKLTRSQKEKLIKEKAGEE